MVHPIFPVVYIIDFGPPWLRDHIDHSTFILVDAVYFYILYIFRDLPPPGHH